MAFQKEIPSGLAEGEESCEDGFGNAGDAPVPPVPLCLALSVLPEQSRVTQS